MIFKTGEYKKYEAFIAATEYRYGIPADLLALLLYQASRYDADHISGKGRRSIGPRAALGIANLTQEDCDLIWNGEDKRLDARASIVGAAVMLRIQYQRFHDWRNAVLAYHSSAEIARDHLQRHKPMPINATQYAQQSEACCRL